MGDENDDHRLRFSPTAQIADADVSSVRSYANGDTNEPKVKGDSGPVMAGFHRRRIGGLSVAGNFRQFSGTMFQQPESGVTKDGRRS